MPTMTGVQAPIPAEQVTIVPANEASWDDLGAIFGGLRRWRAGGVGGA
jgi:hypothetical protein